MWRKKHIKFLTGLDFDKELLINTLKNYDEKNLESEDKSILKNILMNFERGDFSLLTTQEIQFLQKNPKEDWPLRRSMLDLGVLTAKKTYIIF